MSSPITALYDKITDFFAQGGMSQRLQYAIDSGALGRGVFVLI